MSAPKQPTQEKVEEKADAKTAVESFHLPEYGVTVKATSKQEAIKKAKQLKEDK